MTIFRLWLKCEFCHIFLENTPNQLDWKSDLLSWVFTDLDGENVGCIYWRTEYKACLCLSWYFMEMPSIHPQYTGVIWYSWGGCCCLLLSHAIHCQKKTEHEAETWSTLIWLANQTSLASKSICPSNVLWKGVRIRKIMQRLLPALHTPYPTGLMASSPLPPHII